MTTIGTAFGSSVTERRPFGGVLVPALTPFKADGSVDEAAFLDFCRWLLDQGANGLAVFGTTSEANSLSLAERMSLLEMLIDNKIPARTLMPGTGACSVPEAVQLTKAAISAGAGGVLVLPPFYYKNVSEDGVFAYYAEVIERVGKGGLRLYLYHIPQMSGVAITPAIVARLLAAYGPVIAGLKDSSGNWENTERLLREFPDLAIFPGSESFLLAGLRAGGAGCISATANFQAGRIRKLIDTPDGEARERLNERVGRVRAAFEKYPLIPGLKAATANRFGREAWRIVRPPLRELAEGQRRELTDALAALDEAD
ncbi:MAG TPA: dihydrodipicolinate synthase family protein [Phycisphaerae bacterium]|jgi:4-hydroxy-tetrahydrodipicolinate synthase|nr:dihydrodipicolinate synthase family protein [Phycisphaerae bacterium]